MIVTLREDTPGEARLACYYLDPQERGYDAARLRSLAAEDLPDYMIPATWTKLERLPLTPAGKIDRAALPAPEPVTLQSFVREPATVTETAMATIWREVLHLERVGLDDDFFALGGDSIQLFQITARANHSGLRLAAKELLKHPKLEDLAAYLDSRAPAYPKSATVNAIRRQWIVFRRPSPRAAARARSRARSRRSAFGSNRNCIPTIPRSTSPSAGGSKR